MSKKLLKSFSAVVLAVAGIFAVSYYSNAAVKGDVNGDGEVTAADVTAVYDVLLGNSDQFLVPADVNGDGDVTAADVTYIYDILLGNIPAEYDHVYILGNGEWNPTAGQEMTTQDGVTYTATLEANNVYDGYSWFGFTTKLADAESETPWDDIAEFRFGAISEGDFLVTDEIIGTTINLTNEGYQAFQIPVGKYELSLNLNELTLVITKVEEPIADVYVLGEINGNTWDATNGVQMTTEDGQFYTVEATFAGENDGYSYFSFTTKLADAESETPWDDIAGFRFGAVSEGDFLVSPETLNTPLNLTYENGQAFKIPAGEYTLSIDLQEMTIVITKAEEPQPETNVYILGEVNGKTWSATDGVQMTANGNVFTAHVTTAGENDGYSYFSFTKALADTTSETPWDDIAASRFGAVSNGDFLVTSSMAGQALPLTYENGQAFKIPAGEFDLTVNLDSMTLVIEGNIVDPVEPQPENKVYILGEVNGNSWATDNGVEMTSEDGNIYTANITTQTYSYFSFTTKLSENADDWDGIAQYRFGAVGDADVLVTEDYLGETLPLTTDGYQAFKIAAGQFTLTLNMEEMTLKIEGTFEQQPEPGNGWYLIGTPNNWSTSDKSYPFVQDAQNENVYSIHVDNVSGDFWFKIAAEGNYDLGDFWSGDFLSAATDGESALSGTLVQGNQGAFCVPGSYNCTYLDITIDVENLTYTITTDGQEPIVDPTAEYDYVYIAGTADGWSGNGGKLASVKDANDYYGFINATGEFKIQKQQGSWATNWGGSNGTLVSGGANIQANGNVYVNANIGNMTYSVTEITSMAVIGDATTGGWDTETALTYNAETGAWEGTVTFTTGEFKFRANNGWDINFGGALNNLTIGGSNIAVEAGTYNVVLTLVCPGEYTATLTPAN